MIVQVYMVIPVSRSTLFVVFPSAFSSISFRLLRSLPEVSVVVDGIVPRVPFLAVAASRLQEDVVDELLPVAFRVEPIACPAFQVEQIFGHVFVQIVFRRGLLFTPAGGSLEKQTVTTKNLTDNTLYATKLVFGHPLWGGNLSFGGEYTYTNRDNSYMNVEGILDNNNSSIKENSTSAFLEYARSFGKLQAQLGVRYEHLSSDYYEDGKYMDEQSRTYDNVFPSISLNLPIGKVQTQLTYTGSIYRPSYWMLRSDIMYGNRYTYEGGNPLLRPSLINRLTLNVSYKWIYLNSRYIHGEDAITQLSRAYSEDDPTVSLYSFYNMYNSDKLYTTLTLSPTIGLWSPQFNFLLLQQWYKVETSNGTENFNNPILNFAWNNNFKLPLGISLDVDLGFDTPGDNENTKVEEWCWFTNISLYKSFFKDRLSVQLKAYDLFNSYQAKSTIYSGNRLMTGKMEARRNIKNTNCRDT
jgi:hypothetical protein